MNVDKFPKIVILDAPSRVYWNDLTDASDIATLERFMQDVADLRVYAQGSGPLKYWTNFKVSMGSVGLPVRFPHFIPFRCPLMMLFRAECGNRPVFYSYHCGHGVDRCTDGIVRVGMRRAAAASQAERRHYRLRCCCRCRCGEHAVTEA